MRRALIVLGLLIPAAVYVIACSDDNTDNPSNPIDASTPDTSKGDSSNPDTDSGDQDSGSDGGIQRGPATIQVDGDPISMVYDDAKQTLFIADNTKNQIWSWTDKDGLKKFATVKDDPEATDSGRTNLGQIIELADGTLVVPRFGGSGANTTVGAILTVAPDGSAGEVPNIEKTRKRTALAVDPTSGKIYGGYFITPGDGKGVVTIVDLATGETTYSGGFQKPVGTLVVNNQLYVSDQTQNAIFAMPLDGGFDDGGPFAKVADVPLSDVLTPGPNGSVFTGQFKPLSDGGPIQIRQIWPDGGVDNLFSDAGLVKAQGVAYDKTNKRLFVADSNGTLVRTIKIFPVD